MARDVGHSRVIKAAEVWPPADEPLAWRVGRLLGKAISDATIDALVAVTALAVREGNGSAHCIVLTSDPDDLSALLAEEPGVRVVAV